MRKIAFSFVLAMLAAGSLPVFADTPDTVVMFVRMTGANEVPAINTTAHAFAKLRFFVNRNAAGAITSGTADLELFYTFAAPATLTGLHIHDGPAGVASGVVISFGVGPNVTDVTSGTINRRTEITSGAALDSLNGLLKAPHLYYLNLHTRVNPGGEVRGQLVPQTLTFRTKLSPANEVPPIEGLAASGVATITLRAERDNGGFITGANVDFDVAYNFPGAVSITGLHIHPAPAGVNGPVRISSGLGGAAGPVVDSDGVGNVFRRAEITTADAQALEAVNGIFENPSNYYVNLHTTVNPGGAIRGQLSRDVLSFRTDLLPSNEAPPVSSAGKGVGTLTISVVRDKRGHATSGSAEFDVDYTFPGAVTLTGLHVHNAREGISAGVVISSGFPSTSDSDGSGNVKLTANIDSTNTNGVTALNGLLLNPSLYYLNLHTTDNPGGVIRGQLELETFVFRPLMRAENEVPVPTVVGAQAAALISFRVTKNAAGDITGGTVDFAVNYAFGSSAITIVGLHIHRGVEGTNGPVVIGTSIGSPDPVTDDNGTGNLFERVTIPPDSPAAAVLLEALDNPAGFYVNLHTSAFPGGLVRGQLATNRYDFPQAGGGADFVSLITLINTSSTRSVSGVAYFFSPTGGRQSVTANDAVVPFSIPPSGKAIFSNNPKGPSGGGYARIDTDGPVDENITYSLPGRTPAFARSSQVGKFAIPVSFAGGSDPALAIVNLRTVPSRIFLILEDSTRAPVARFFLDFAPGQQRSFFVREIFVPPTTSFFGPATSSFSLQGFTGRLRVQSVDGFSAGNGLIGVGLEFRPTAIGWLPPEILP